MKIDVYSRGFTRIDADAQWQVPGIASAITERRAAQASDADVALAILDCTDSERSDISHDEYAVVTDDDGTVIWAGWLHGDPSVPPPAEAQQ